MYVGFLNTLEVKPPSSVVGSKILVSKKASADGASWAVHSVHMCECVYAWDKNLYLAEMVVWILVCVFHYGVCVYIYTSWGTRRCTGEQSQKNL